MATIVAAGDDRHDLADERAAVLVVEGHDLRPAEHFEPARFLQGAQQHADAVAAGREHEAAEAEVGADAVDGEAGQALGADAGRPWPAKRSLPELGRPNAGSPKLKPGVSVGRLHDLLRDGGHGAAGACVWVVVCVSLDVAQQAAIEQRRVLQAELDAELVGVAQAYFADEHLDHDHRRLLVELLDDALRAPCSTPAWRRR